MLKQDAGRSGEVVLYFFLGGGYCLKLDRLSLSESGAPSF